MKPNKQVSPVIRISQGERDVSARATHLEAATRKFLVTTNERKQMSTKTNFKRIALVAVAALGMGVLSSVPSQAAILSTVSLTTVNGTSTKATSDSVTSGASVKVNYLTNGTDSVVLSALIKSMPAGAATPTLKLAFGDTVGSTAAVVTPTGLNEGANRGEGASLTSTGGITVLGVAGNVTVNFRAFLDPAAARTIGTYTFAVTATPFAGLVQPAITTDISFVVAALASESTVASSGVSKAFMHSDASTVPTVDITSSGLATASTTPRAWLYVNLLNTESAQAVESVTLTTTIGNFGPHGGVSTGKSLTVAYTAGGAKYYPLFADGTAGTAVITVKSASVTFPNKSFTFYAATPATLVASVLNSVPGVGTNDNAVQVVAKDSNGNLWGGSLAIYSDTVATISDTGTACVNANSTVGAFLCPVTGVVAGTAKVKAYISAQTVVSNEVSLTVSTATPATVKLSWDKATYAPGEKATLKVEALGSTGAAVPNGTFGNLFATGGITLSTSAGNGSDTLTAVSVTTSTAAQDFVGTATTPAKLYTVYMPAAGGTVTASATGGTSLPIAGQVKVTAAATVTDSGAAALAAVTALATQVASLRTLITTLTNLVLKIQKKVKA
jgi:hypothetical protein